MARDNDDDEMWEGSEGRSRRARQTTLERHAQTIFGALALAAMLWVGATLIDLSKEQVRTGEQLTQMRMLITALQTQLAQATNDRYTNAEARQTVSGIEVRLADHEKRLDRLERRK